MKNFVRISVGVIALALSACANSPVIKVGGLDGASMKPDPTLPRPPGSQIEDIEGLSID